MNMTLTQERKRSMMIGFFATSYGVSSLCFMANFYSYGLTYSPPVILLAIVLLGPLFGALSLFVEALILKGIGNVSRCKADFFTLLYGLAKSKTPTLFLVLFWMGFLAADPSSVFMQDISNGSATFIVLGTMGVICGSFWLLTKYLQEMQGVRGGVSFCHVFLMYTLSFLAYVTILFVARYIYISTF